MPTTATQKTKAKLPPVTNATRKDKSVAKGSAKNLAKRAPAKAPAKKTVAKAGKSAKKR